MREPVMEAIAAEFGACSNVTADAVVGVFAEWLRDENGAADSAVGQAITDAQRQGLGIVGTARAVRQALALELAHQNTSGETR